MDSCTKLSKFFTDTEAVGKSPSGEDPETFKSNPDNDPHLFVTKTNESGL